MKKKIFLLPLICFLACSCGGKSERNNHEHTFSSEYTYDNEYHWRKATCEHTNEVADKAKHNFGDWKVVIQPTEYEEGKQIRSCKTCGYTETQKAVLPEKGSTIDYPLEVKEIFGITYGSSKTDITDKQYFVKGEVTSAIFNNNNDVTLTLRNNRTSEPFYSFTFESGKVDTYLIKDQYDAEGLENATVTIYGYIELYGSAGDMKYRMRKFNSSELVSGVEFTPTIVNIENGVPVNKHVHKFSDIWSYNETHHWHQATCSHTNLSRDYGEHSFAPWVTTKEATSIEEGQERRTCTVCGYYEDRTINIIGHTHAFATAWSYNETKHWHAATCGHDVKGDEGNHDLSAWTTEIAATTTQDGKESRTCSICGYKEERTIDKVNPSASGTFTLYTFNDFHGAVNEYSSESHIGLAKFGTYLKNVSQQDNVLIIDSGDTFQGSIESNWNNGALITEVFNYAHVDVHTLGNHDFDWGESKIEDNKAKTASDGWSMTNLAANIYDYDFDSHIEGDVQQSRLGDKYYIKTMKNGIKVGVVGVIGRNQITSICSPLVEDICFKEHIQILKDLSDELRTRKGCNVVIASIHDSAEDSLEKGLSDVSSVSGKKYFDYVACGHSHRDENYTENGVPFTQAACYGECIYKANVTVNNGAVSNYDINKLSYSTITSSASTIDSNITSIINKYAPAYSSVGSEVIAHSVSGRFYKNQHLPNLLCKAAYLEAKSEGYSVDMAYCNDARYNIDAGSWTYANLYEAFPFDNVIYVVKMKGSKNLNEIRDYNYVYHDASLTETNVNTWYTVAVIDYLLFHTSDNREYNYFSFNSNYMQVLGTLKKSNGENYLYRDICADYLRSLTGTLRNSDYLTSNAEFTKPAVV